MGFSKIIKNGCKKITKSAGQPENKRCRIYS